MSVRGRVIIFIIDCIFEKASSSSSYFYFLLFIFLLSQLLLLIHQLINKSIFISFLKIFKYSIIFLLVSLNLLFMKLRCYDWFSFRFQNIIYLIIIFSRLIILLGQKLHLLSLFNDLLKPNKNLFFIHKQLRKRLSFAINTRLIVQFLFTFFPYHLLFILFKIIFIFCFC